MRPSLHPLMGPPCFRQRECFVDPRSQLAVKHTLKHLVGVVLAAHRRADDRQLLPNDESQVGFGYKPGDKAAAEQPAVPSETAHDSRPTFSAQWIDDDINTTLVGQLAHCLLEFDFARVDPIRSSAPIVRKMSIFASPVTAAMTCAPRCLAI